MGCGSSTDAKETKVVPEKRIPIESKEALMEQIKAKKFPKICFFISH